MRLHTCRSPIYLSPSPSPPTYPPSALPARTYLPPSPVLPTPSPIDLSPPRQATTIIPSHLHASTLINPAPSIYPRLTYYPLLSKLPLPTYPQQHPTPSKLNSAPAFFRTLVLLAIYYFPFDPTDIGRTPALSLIIVI